MSWRNIKSLIIALLLVVNLFLLGTLSITRYRAVSISPAVRDAGVQILTQNGFSDDNRLIPRRKVIASPLDVSFASPSELSMRFFGREVAFQTDGDTLLAHADSATLLVRGNYVCYDTGEPGEGGHYRRLKRALERAGFDMRDAVYDEEENYFYKLYNGKNLFNMYLRAELDDSGNLTYVSAQWPQVSPRSEQVITHVSSFFPVFPDHFTARGPLSEVEFGYSLIESSAQSGYLFYPAWRVSVAAEETEIFVAYS